MAKTFAVEIIRIATSAAAQRRRCIWGRLIRSLIATIVVQERSAFLIGSRSVSDEATSIGSVQKESSTSLPSVHYLLHFCPPFGIPL
jgi:hypothetical protein